MKSKFIKIMFVAALCASVAMIGGAIGKQKDGRNKTIRLGQLATGCSWQYEKTTVSPTSGATNTQVFYNCLKSLQSMPSGSPDSMSRQIEMNGRAACVSVNKSNNYPTWKWWGYCGK